MVRIYLSKHAFDDGLSRELSVRTQLVPVS